MTAKIERGIPIPKRNASFSKFGPIFAAMKPGDSFVWPNASAPLTYAKRYGLKITTRKLNGGGFRVWLNGK